MDTESQGIIKKALGADHVWDMKELSKHYLERGQKILALRKALEKSMKFIEDNHHGRYAGQNKEISAWDEEWAVIKQIGNKALEENK